MGQTIRNGHTGDITMKTIALAALMLVALACVTSRHKQPNQPRLPHQPLINALFRILARF
jgi:hypothetical protein